MSEEATRKMLTIVATVQHIIRRTPLHFRSYTCPFQRAAASGLANSRFVVLDGDDHLGSLTCPRLANSQFLLVVKIFGSLNAFVAVDAARVWPNLRDCLKERDVATDCSTGRVQALCQSSGSGHHASGSPRRKKKGS